jgi:hypothetical protein
MEKIIEGINLGVFFVLTTVFCMLIGIVIIYLIRIYTDKKNKKILYFFSMLLISLIFISLIFVYNLLEGFLSPSLIILLIFLTLAMLFSGFKVILNFPKIPHKLLIKYSMITLIILNSVSFLLPVWFSNPVFGILRAITAILLIMLIYAFSLLFFMNLEKSNNKILELRWRKK